MNHEILVRLQAARLHLRGWPEAGSLRVRLALAETHARAGTLSLEGVEDLISGAGELPDCAARTAARDCLALAGFALAAPSAQAHEPEEGEGPGLEEVEAEARRNLIGGPPRPNRTIVDCDTCPEGPCFAPGAPCGPCLAAESALLGACPIFQTTPRDMRPGTRSDRIAHAGKPDRATKASRRTRGERNPSREV